MKRSIISWATIISLIIPFAVIGQLDNQTKKQFESTLKGQRRWLKIDVLKKTGLLGGDDVTYILQDETVEYKSEQSTYFDAVLSKSVDEFVEKTLKISQDANINLFERGTPVILHAVKFDEKKLLNEVEIKIGITDENNDEKSAIKFIFTYTGLTIEKIHSSLAIAFSDSEWSDENTPLALAKKLTGQKKWLKIIVAELRENTGTRGASATSIFPDGKIYYKFEYRIGIQTQPYQTESLTELENEVRHRLRGYSTEIWSKGTQVTIHPIVFPEKWKKSNYHVLIPITDFRGSKASIKGIFDFGGHTVEQFQRIISTVFADDESQLQTTSSTVKLDLGMTIEEVIKQKGAPKTRAELGSKIILTYDDVKIIFQEGKLVDVQ